MGENHSIIRDEFPASPIENEVLAKITPDKIGSSLELAFLPAEGVFPCS
jgi:hypothetical protein